MSFLEAPPSNARNVIPSDSTDLPRETRGIYCGTGGDLHVLMIDDSEVTFKNLAGEVIHGMRLKKIFATGTTATDIIGLL